MLTRICKEIVGKWNVAFQTAEGTFRFYVYKKTPLVYGTSPRDRNKKAFDLLPLVTRRVSKTSSSLVLLGSSYLTRIRQKPFGVTKWGQALQLPVSSFPDPMAIAILNSWILRFTHKSLGSQTRCFPTF